MINSRDRVQSCDDLDLSAAHGWLRCIGEGWQANNIGQRMSDHQSCELVVDNTVDGKDNLEEKTRGVADVRMQHLSCNFLNMAGCTGEGFITSTTISAKGCLTINHVGGQQLMMINL